MSAAHSNIGGLCPQFHTYVDCLLNMDEPTGDTVPDEVTFLRFVVHSLQQHSRSYNSTDTFCPKNRTFLHLFPGFSVSQQGGIIKNRKKKKMH